MSGIQAEHLSRQGWDTAGSIPRIQVETQIQTGICLGYRQNLYPGRAGIQQDLYLEYRWKLALNTGRKMPGIQAETLFRKGF
jgi:hypothetical protein